MNILLSNDDGIAAEGLARLAGAMTALGDVYVIAPHVQRSASSHAISLGSAMVLREVSPPPGARRAWSLTGTPVDCVKLGLDLLRRDGIRIDLVYAGINHGANLGSDTLYSGTVSAAAEAVFLGYPAAAVSVCSHAPTYFEAACHLAVETADPLMAYHRAQNGGNRSVLSINTPDLPAAAIKGVRPARLGIVQYDNWFREAGEADARDEKGARTYLYTGTPLLRDTAEADIDAHLINEGYATVSMVRYDLNDPAGYARLRSWGLSLQAERAEPGDAADPAEP